MARPVKFSIDYFPIDVDIFDDEKIIPMSSEYGAQGEAILIRILCSIYRNGYFMECTESFLYKIAKQAAVSHEIVEGVIRSLIKWDFFDKNTFDKHNVLTSAGIQKRWKEAVRKRVILSDSLSYWIEANLEETPVSAEETPILQEETQSNGVETTQKKREEKKEKKETKKEGFNFSFVEAGYVEPMRIWLAYKQRKRESYKDEDSIRACYKNLHEISRGSPAQAEMIINKSISNNYSGLFPLKKHELTQLLQNESGTTSELQGANKGTRTNTLSAEN